MDLSCFQKIILGIAGLTALIIGSFIVLAPQTFYASYGIELGTDASLLSELRAPGAGLATLGAVMLSGVVRSTWAPLAIAAAFTVYLAFPAGRLVGILMDGMPSGGIVSALIFELVVLALLCAAFGRRRAFAMKGERLT